MTTQINVANLSNNFKHWQICRKTNNTFWEPLWQASIKEQLKELPQGNGINKHIIFDWNESTPGNLLFLLSFHQKDKQGKHCGFTYHELSIQTSVKGFKLKITGKDQYENILNEEDNNTMKHLYKLFHNTFYYKPDYHKNPRIIIHQLQAQYERLKNFLTRVLPRFKKQLAKP